MAALFGDAKRRDRRGKPEAWALMTGGSLAIGPAPDVRDEARVRDYPPLAEV